jgi:hypothetical protein
VWLAYLFTNPLPNVQTDYEVLIDRIELADQRHNSQGLVDFILNEALAPFQTIAIH